MRQLREVWGARSHTLGVIARLDRAIQYAEAVVVERTGRGVLDGPVSAPPRLRRGSGGCSARRSLGEGGRPGHDSGTLGCSVAFGDMADTSQPSTHPKTALTFAQIATT